MCEDCKDRKYVLSIPRKNKELYKKFLINKKLLLPTQIDYIFKNDLSESIDVLNIEENFQESLTSLLLKNNLTDFKLKIKK